MTSSDTEGFQAIDVCGLVHDQDCWEAYLRAFADAAPRYLEVFAKPLGRATGVDPGKILALVSANPHRAVDVLIDSGRLELDLDAHMRELETAGIVLQIIHGSPRPLPDGSNVNDRVAGFARSHPKHLRCWAGVSLSDPASAVMEIMRCTEDLGTSGVSIIPFLDGVDPSDDSCAPIFETATELGLPVWLHAGQSFAGRLPMDLTGWRQFDALAGRHQDLVLVAGHGGWPFIREMVALCQRHPNLYLELSSHRTKSMRSPGSGWEPLLLHGRGSIRSRVLFGSTAWVHNESVGVLAAEFAALASGPEQARDWLFHNASRMLSRAGGHDGRRRG